jgi:hypothetical protein
MGKNVSVAHYLPIPVAALPKAFVCGQSLAGNAGLISREHGCLFPVSVVCYKVEISVSCGVSH